MSFAAAFGAVLPIAAAVTAAGAAETVSPSLKEVYDAHLCDLQERLLRIHRQGDADSSSRHLIVAPEGQPTHYVQCRFDDDENKMPCEAASGYYPVQPGPRRPHRGDAAALTALGFEIGREGNDAREVELGQPPDFARVARLMLRALHDGYGFRKPAELVVEAPLAEEPGPPLPGCTPVG